MSTSGSKSNEHVAHFLVDIHTSNSSDPESFFYEGTGNYPEPVMEICSNGSIIRITNHINPQLLSIVLSQLGGTK